MLGTQYTYTERPNDKANGAKAKMNNWGMWMKGKQEGFVHFFCKL